MAVMQQRSEAVVSELFRSVCAEIRDEVSLSGAYGEGETRVTCDCCKNM